MNNELDHNNSSNDLEMTPENQIVDNDSVLQWKCHPAMRRPWVTLGVTLFLLLISLIVFYMTDSKTFTTLALVIMFASLAKFYFPTSYRLDSKRITIKTTTQTLHKEWSIFRSFYPDKNGVLLSPFVSPTRLENFRGLYIMFNNNRDEVVNYVRQRLATTSTESSDGDS